MAVTTKEGFEIVNGTKSSSKIIFRKNGVYVNKSYLLYTYTSLILVYFVSGSNGDEFGQFKNKESALAKANKMALLTTIDRKRFNE